MAEEITRKELIDNLEKFKKFISELDLSTFGITDEMYRNFKNRYIDGELTFIIKTVISFLYDYYEIKKISLDPAITKDDKKRKLTDFCTRLLRYIQEFIRDTSYQIMHITRNIFSENIDIKEYIKRLEDNDRFLFQFNEQARTMLNKISFLCLRLLGKIYDECNEYLKKIDELPVNPSFLPPVGGSLYYHKYMKYKNKYKQLKNHQ